MSGSAPFQENELKGKEITLNLIAVEALNRRCQCVKGEALSPTRYFDERDTGYFGTVNKINYPNLLASWSVFDVAASGEYHDMLNLPRPEYRLVSGVIW